MSRFITKFGNVLDSPDAKIIGHQVNCVGVMGGGLARQIKERYPEVYDDYRNSLSTLYGKCLGGCLLSKCNDGKYIANLFGQYYYRGYFPDELDYLSDSNPWHAPELSMDGHVLRFTNYEALYRSLINLRDDKLLKFEDNPTIAFPVYLGCGRGGGDWSIVLEMLHTIFRETNNIIELWQRDEN